MNDNFLENATRQFKYYKLLGEKTLAQLRDEDLLWQYNDDSNSIATVIRHLWGNMMSRWTDFLTTDGEKEWRDRDAEFENPAASRQEIMELWESGWNCLFSSLHQLTEEDLNKTIYIRNQGQTVSDAILRQLAHYAYHTGQIVFSGKMICGDQWKSLTIPKGKSQSFNQDKFSKSKNSDHFTSDVTGDSSK